MKYLLLIATIAFAACSPGGFSKLSKSIEDICLGDKRKAVKGITFHEIRKKLYKTGRLHFINQEADTIYMLESYDLQTASFSGRIWNSRQALEYNYSPGGFKFDSLNRYTNYTIKLTEKWDTAAMRYEERHHATSTPVIYIVASKTVIAHKIPHTACISFKEFFWLQRDRFN